jgi:4-hydroxy-tetrahydrodipicolinate synthase
VLEKCGDKLSVLSGDDFTILPLLALGGRGVISVLSNVVPADVAEMVRAYDAGDFARARELHFKTQPLTRALFLETNPIPVKTALALLGRMEAELRLPLWAMQDANVEKLRSALGACGLGEAVR